MKKVKRAVALVAVILGLGTAAWPGGVAGGEKVDAAVAVLRCGARAEHALDLGIGFNWFDHFGAGGYYARGESYPLSTPLYPDFSDEAAWRAIRQGLDELDPGWIRFGLPPDPHVDTDGSFQAGTVHLRRLEWLARWAAERGKVVVLDPFLIPRRHEFPLPADTRDPGPKFVNMAARDNRAYARQFVAPLIDYVVNERKLKAVRYFNAVNEPMEYGVYQTPGDSPAALSHYVDMYREMRTALDARGIGKERVGLIGLDCSDPVKSTLKQHALGVDIDPWVDAYSIHHYNLRFDHLPPGRKPDTGRLYFARSMHVLIELEDREFLEYCRSRGKPFWALEMGSFYYGKLHTPEGVATLDATLTVAEGIIRAINVGLSSFCIWSLMNTNDVDGHWALMGVRDDALVRHGYPFAVYGLLCRHVPAGAAVFPMVRDNPPDLGHEHVHATALESPSGTRSLLIVNDHAERAQDVELLLPKAWVDTMTFERRVIDRSQDGSTSSEVILQNGRCVLTLPPFSLTGLLSQAPSKKDPPE